MTTDVCSNSKVSKCFGHARPIAWYVTSIMHSDSPTASQLLLGWLKLSGYIYAIHRLRDCTVLKIRVLRLFLSKTQFRIWCRDQERSPFFYYVFYTNVFPGFVYFRLIQTLDSTPYIIHSVFYTSWTMSFLLVAKIVWFYTTNCFSSCFLH